MKANFFSLSAVSVFAATLLVTGVALHAADDPSAPVRRPAAGGAGAAAGPGAAFRQGLAQPGGPMGAVAFESVLTEEQRQQVREYMQSHGAGMRENAQKAAQMRRELNVAVFTGQADEKAIKEKTEAIAKLDSEQLRLRMTAFAQVAGSLTDEQKQKIKEIAAQTRMARPGGPGGPGAGPGLHDGDAPKKFEPAAPPPPDK